jgi:hypothetical protein
MERAGRGLGEGLGSAWGLERMERGGEGEGQWLDGSAAE